MTAFIKLEPRGTPEEEEAAYQADVRRMFVGAITDQSFMEWLDDMVSDAADARHACMLQGLLIAISELSDELVERYEEATIG